MLQAAFEYLGMGYSVIPIGANKRPVLAWEPFQTRQATEDEVIAWFDKWPQAGLAIVCGAVSGGLAVVDVDGADNPWPGKDRTPPGGPLCVTGSGGRHFYLRAPAGVDVRNSAGRVAQRVDVRGEGGYVIAPPSVHPRTGNKYAWASPLCAPEDLPEPEPWLLRLMTGEAAVGTRDTGEGGEIAELLRGVSKGARNDAAARVAGHYLGLGLPRDEVALLMGDWNRRNDPPLTDKELRGVLDSIAQRELLKGVDPPAKGEASDEERATWLDEISNQIKVPITAVCRIEGDEPMVEIYSGEAKTLLPVRTLQSKAQFAGAILELCNRLPVLPSKPKEGQEDGKKMSYPRLINRLLASAKRLQPSAEATLIGQVQAWLDEYLRVNRPVAEGEHVTFREPLRDEEGRIWINMTEFHRYSRMRFDNKIPARRFAQDLCRIGFVFKFWRLKGGHGSRMARLYQIPGQIVVSTEVGAERV